MVQVFKAPEKYDLIGKKSVFLAGSIEMGAAEDWQDKVTRLLGDLDVVVLNPRRDDWDDTWKQEKTDPRFSEQVNWELAAQEAVDVIAMYFDIKTTSPITLLELGLFTDTGKVIVCCPEGFYRKGNVDIVCERYNVEQVGTIEELVEAAKKRLFGVKKSSKRERVAKMLFFENNS